MFEFLDEIFKKKEKEKVRLYFSDNMLKFLLSFNIKANNMLLDNEYKSGFCFVDISKKEGFVKVIPTSSYIKILNKHKEDNGYDDIWYNDMKDLFLLFYKNNKDIIEKNFQYMRAGRFVNNILNISPYDVETFVIKYKKYQK